MATRKSESISTLCLRLSKINREIDTEIGFRQVLIRRLSSTDNPIYRTQIQSEINKRLHTLSKLEEEKGIVRNKISISVAGLHRKGRLEISHARDFPPRVALALVRLMANPRSRQSIIDNLEEVYCDDLKKHGKLFARLMCLLEALKMISPALRRWGKRLALLPLVADFVRHHWPL